MQPIFLVLLFFQSAFFIKSELVKEGLEEAIKTNENLLIFLGISSKQSRGEVAWHKNTLITNMYYMFHANFVLKSKYLIQRK